MRSQDHLRDHLPVIDLIESHHRSAKGPGKRTDKEARDCDYRETDDPVGDLLPV